MVLTTKILDNLTKEAMASDRLRIAYDLRTTLQDQSQRMLNALEPGTDLPIHRHMNTSEINVMLRGSVRELIYDDEGNITEDVTLKAGCEPNTISIPAGVWHRLECLEPGTIMFEAKDGPYQPRREEDILHCNE